MIIEGMQAAKAAGAVVSFDLNYRAKLWNISGGEQRAVEVLDRIVKNVDVLVGNEEDLQKGLGIPGPDVTATSKLDPSAFFGMIDQVDEEASAGEGGGDHAARSALDQSPQLERGGVDQRQDVQRADRGAGRVRPRRRRRRVRVGILLRPAHGRVAGGSGEARLGARRAADDVPGRHDDGDAGAGAVVRQGRLGEDPALMDIQEQAAKIKLLLMDVDGVLTNGRLYNVPDPEGKMVETKGFDSQDGIGLQWLSWHGIKTGVISGRALSGNRRSAPASARCRTSTRGTSRRSRFWRRSSPTPRSTPARWRTSATISPIS